jgi:hypothetical protein
VQSTGSGDRVVGMSLVAYMNFMIRGKKYPFQDEDEGETRKERMD